MSLYALHIAQVNSTVLGPGDHNWQHGNAARTIILGKTSETDSTQKRPPRCSGICQIKKTLTILRCLYGSEMVLLWMLIGEQKMPSNDILQENYHATLIDKCQIVAYNFK